VKSFGVLYNNGIQRKNSHQKFCITEIRGDWKMQKDPGLHWGWQPFLFLALKINPILIYRLSLALGGY
jgi:hypothetical protein